MLEIQMAESPSQIVDAKALFREYEAWLGLDLCFQDFEAEVAALPGKYAKPDGRLFLAYAENNLAGCIALRKIGNDVGEMKRLFVRKDFRAHGIGNLLVEKLIAAAREIGYKTIRLDTYPPKMAKAVSLYESHGFREIPPYYHNPYGETYFMELALDAEQATDELLI